MGDHESLFLTRALGNSYAVRFENLLKKQNDLCK